MCSARFPCGIVLNFGYNGSKGTRSISSMRPAAPQRNRSAASSTTTRTRSPSPITTPSPSARGKRLHDGIAMGATYTYCHSIDNASSIGGNGGTGLVVAQNWQDLLAEESNSSFDIRHQVTGNFLYELPFGPDDALDEHRMAGHIAQRYLRFRHL